MSARSPRGSLSGASDVSQDFLESLQDLQQNNRYEIGNLTIIARESTEHAQAISRVLENHIRTTFPNRKLPALYVLDSIVKNVGTPYTVYLGRNLYSTFMEAYTQVDGMTRRNMENMLKTWKEPVPGSIDPRPVFPPEVVRPIENALIKARTAALQNQRQVQPQGAYRSTPTPPQQYGQYIAPPMAMQPQPQPNGQYGYGNQQPTPQPTYLRSSYHPPTPIQQPSYTAAPIQQPSVDIDSLKVDLNSLVSRVQHQFSTAPGDQAVRTKLGALLQLQKAVNEGMVSGSALQQVRDQVTAMAASMVPVPRPTPQAAVLAPQWQAPLPMQQPYQQPQVDVPLLQRPPPQAQALPQFVDPGALNGLQALLSNGQKPSTPQMRSAMPALQGASHVQLSNVQNSVAAAPPSNTSDLLAALAKSGVLSGIPSSSGTPTQPPSVSAAPAQPAVPSSMAALLQSLQGVLPAASQSGTPILAPQQLANTKLKVPMTSAALKTFRPELVRALYDYQPNQCSNCGRRFLATEEGRAKKERHLDWHFRTNQRMADPNTSRGQHRNWFVDEMEWIRLTEFDPSTATADDVAKAAVGAKKQKGPQEQYVRAPAGVTKTTCSICQEEMQSTYSEEEQDWVFMNAVTYHGKIAHATCVEEIKKATALPPAGSAMAAALAQRQRSATPDSTLGKRKADGVLAGTGPRVKTG